MNWRISIAFLVLGTCLAHSAQSLESSRGRKETVKSSDGLFFDDEELAQADEASGSGPVEAPTLDEISEDEDDVIEEDDDEVSVVENQPAPVTPTSPTSSAAPTAQPPAAGPKVSAVASKPVPPPPTFDDDDIEVGSGSGAGPDVDAEDDYDDVDDKSITGENEGEETEDDVEDIEETTVRNVNPINPRIVVPVNTPPPPPAPSAEPPREENQIPAVTTAAPTPGPGPALPPVDDNDTGNGGRHTLGHKPEDRPVSFFAQPGILAAVVGGAVVGLLCAILLVMFIVYRMRKKDEGSYALDEPKRSPNSYAYNKNSREFFA